MNLKVFAHYAIVSMVLARMMALIEDNQRDLDH